jgi:hypothetical protein
MSRTLFVGFAFLLACSLATPGVAAAGQGDADSPLAADELILRVSEGSGYVVLETVAGEPLQDEGYLFRDGAPAADDLPEDLVASFQDLGVQDVYISSTNLTADEGDSAITVTNRVYLVQSDDAAKDLVETFFDEVVEQAEQYPNTPQDPERLASLPDHDAAIDGWSATYQYVNINTGENPVGVPGFRFVAQVGAAVASTEVFGTDVSVSVVELAEAILLEQVACLYANAPCAALPFPGDLSDGSRPPSDERDPGAGVLPADDRRLTRRRG